MELKLLYPNHVNTLPNKKALTLINNSPSNPAIQIQLPLHKSQYEPYQPVKNTIATSYIVYETSIKNNTDLPIQIQLPLHKPQHKPRQAIKKTTTIFDLVHEATATRKNTTTCSDILDLMNTLNLPIPLDLYISLIKECTHSRDRSQAIKLHKHITTNRICPSLRLLNRLLLMYVSCDCFDHARYMFERMPVRNLNAWAVMIAGCVENEKYEEAMHLFMKMQCEYEFTYEHKDAIDFMVSGIVVCVLKACVETISMELGKQIHGWIIKLGYSKNSVLSSFLIRFYGKFGCFEGGDIVFDHVFCRNTVVWTARIVNCCNEEKFEGAVNVFKEMGREGVKKNSFTFSSVLKACGKVKDGGCCGRQVQANAIKLGLDLDGYVQCGLIDMYGKCGLVKEARRVFEMVGEKRNDACWNALLTGYVQHGYCIKAIKLLYQMKAAGVQPPGSLLDELRIVCGGCLIGIETDNL